MSSGRSGELKASPDLSSKARGIVAGRPRLTSAGYPTSVKQCEMEAMTARRAAKSGFVWGLIGGLALIGLMSLGGSILGLRPLPQALNEPLLAIMPGFVFGFLIDTLQHAGKVVE